MSRSKRVSAVTVARHFTEQPEDRRALYAGIRASIELSENAKHALHALLDRDGLDGMPPGTATITQSALGDAIGMSLPTAARMVAELTRAGVVNVERYYPRNKLPSGERSDFGASVFKFDWDAIRRVSRDPVKHEPSVADMRALARQLDAERARADELQRQLAEVNGLNVVPSSGEPAVTASNNEAVIEPAESRRKSQKEIRIRCIVITGAITGDGTRAATNNTPPPSIPLRHGCDAFALAEAA